MLGAINKFTTNRKGAFAMQFALMAVPLCVCTGLAIDGGRAFLARFELASALDAAALAAGSTLTEGADLDAVARKFVEANFKTQHDEPITLELTSDDDVLTLKGSVAINTFFMPLVGQPYVTVSAQSEVRRGGNNVEVALALDITESMNSTRMNGLKEASKLLIDEVVAANQTPYFSKVAIVPWGSNVHPKNTHLDAAAIEELRGSSRGTTGISGATWRDGSTTTKTISAAGWRTNTGRAVSNATWKNGSAISITQITKVSSNTRIQVRYSASSSTYYANGDTVYITGAAGSYAGLNGGEYKVADRTTTSPYTFNLQQVGTSTYVTPPSGSTNSTSGSSQRCLYTNCEMRITTSSSHGFATGDFVYINGVNTSGGGSSVNNTWGTTWTITSQDSTNFTLNGTDGPTFANYSSSGTASECYADDCRYRVTTSTTHGFTASDNLFIWGVTDTSSGTSLNTATNSSISPEDPSGTNFFLPGDARNYRTWSSGGSVAECANALCNVVVTSNNHGLANGERVEIKSVGGLTGINNTTSRLSWVTTWLSNNSYRLNDSTPALSNMNSNYTSGGTSQCLSHGCNRMWFINRSGAEKVNPLSNCVTERYGADAYTDTSPATSPLGMHYAGGDSFSGCSTANYVTPLTPDKNRLKTAVDNLTVVGSTAGQTGVAWGWYLLSPNFAHIWDKEPVNQPLAYGTPELAKVLILMTDGEFNTAHCNGVVARDYGVSGNAERINCNPTSAPFAQAEAACTAAKKAGIIIYTVGLELNTAQYGDDFLLGCATSPQHAFLAANAEQLKDAFKKIATSISKLRLSK